MTLGDIKAEALRLMFANGSEDIRGSDIDRLQSDERYADYLLNMTGAINRALSVIEERGVLPHKVCPLPDGTVRGDGTVRYELTAIPDYFDIVRIVLETDTEYIGACEYRREAEQVILRHVPGGEHRLIYRPRATRVTPITDNGTDVEQLGVPERIACHIPYFIKGELYRQDEPNEASEARNWFESAIVELLYHARDPQQTAVESVLSVGVDVFGG